MGTLYLKKGEDGKTVLVREGERTLEKVEESYLVKRSNRFSMMFVLGMRHPYPILGFFDRHEAGTSAVKAFLERYFGDRVRLKE